MWGIIGMLGSMRTMALNTTCEWSVVEENFGLDATGIRQINDISRVQCMALCELETNYDCRSVDFFDDGEETVCFLPAFEEDLALTPKQDHTYYEFVCNEVDDVDPCTLGKEVGTGSLNIKRYYFNQSTGKCNKFKWSGKGGNTNNFLSKKDCARACKGV